MKSSIFKAQVAVRLTLVGVTGFLALCAIGTLPAQQQTPPQKADSILILKKDHVMELQSGGKVIRTYKVALGQGGLAPTLAPPTPERPKAFGDKENI